LLTEQRNFKISSYNKKFTYSLSKERFIQFELKKTIISILLIIS